MKKKVLITLLSLALYTTACGTPQASSSNSPSDLDTLGSVEVEQNLFDVTLNIPKDFVGESTQADLDKLCEEKNFKSITLNADGSATYVMTNVQHKELMKEYRDNINNSLSELVGSENYPNFTNITSNDDFTEFTITTKSAKLDFNESLSVLVFYMYGGLYSVFNGNEVDNISVTFVNADSGEVISISNSSDMAK